MTPILIGSFTADDDLAGTGADGFAGSDLEQLIRLRKANIAAIRTIASDLRCI
jgi:hypothetical protein